MKATSIFRFCLKNFLIIFSCIVVLEISTSSRYLMTVRDNLQEKEATDSLLSFRTFDYYDCSKINTLHIVKELGRGKQKTVFEVILPTGEHVAAKRCSHLMCETNKLIIYEEHFYRKLYEAFDTKALVYYGFCSFNSGNPKVFDPNILTMGSTLLIELGTPALALWDDWNSKEEELRPKSKDDLEDLRDIARQYDAFPGGPLLMSGDNIYPHQYMRNKAGRLRHIDFDMVEQMPPPVSSTLEKNCAVMLGGFAKLKRHDSRLNCSSGYREESNLNITKISERVFTSSTVPPHPHPINNYTRPPFIISPLPTNMALVHLGKTAGSTLSLNLRHGCHMFVKHPCRGNENRNYGTNGGPGKESSVSQLTKGYYHFNLVPVNKHDGYIISSRNPIDRVVSAFLYVHPSNVAITTKHRAHFLKRNRGKENLFVEEYDMFFECFPDVSALAMNLVGDSNCAKLGRNIIGGGNSTMKSEMLNHFSFGYKFYASDLLVAGSRIFALRQEHLVTDWINFNLRLGGEPHEISGTNKDFKDKLEVKIPPGGLSKEERKCLCVALADELKVYLGVIDAADNLTKEEKKESRREINDGCFI
mmetsp:Transcript_6981/g.8628  ORF Transcript_6981/g.8628 Transcript_6981/m.8628 type:complete len:588 (-) Transcript_6981:139-1902(-)